ncbi:hypothetical protein [Enterococcus wangshanyuanii]|uniref:Uncharacterized protein n=1 Tax=Enterococcus wangshanyuanii TaxID=2005703 RepID=A0ABQ1PXL6_9ENTE|nr:hypothetical protein [Enterococcus wangshanyuanii]GGD06295.1 hypothetical protein GCM10011573_39640 [Enterococcus wangshanyuanii]
MTEKTNIAKLKETAEQLQNIKNGIGTNDNKVKMDAFVALNKLNKVIGRLESACETTPPFAVGEYYSSDGGEKIVKILGNVANQIEYCVYDAQYGTFKKWYIPEKDMTAVFPNLTPATAEQIETFKRAEQFAAKGRKLDEFRVGIELSSMEKMK